LNTIDRVVDAFPGMVWNRVKVVEVRGRRGSATRLEAAMKSAIRSILVSLPVLLLADVAGVVQARAAETQVSFSQDIGPLLQWRCGACHKPGGAGFQKSGFDLTSYEGVMKGTNFGPMVIPGDPESSNLMRLIDWRVSAEIRMPHGNKKLSVCDRDVIRDWIRQGAKNN
jgi:hypothetical protein